MNPTIKTGIVTSRVADQHYEKIKAEHANLLTGIQNQSLRLQALNSQRLMQERDQANIDADRRAQLRKEQMTFDAQKMQADLKNRELSIKQAALANP